MYWKYEWVLPVYRYEGLESLLATLAEKVIVPAEGKVKRRMIEADSYRVLCAASRPPGLSKTQRRLLYPRKNTAINERARRAISFSK
jgi:hypothetical protein